MRTIVEIEVGEQIIESVTTDTVPMIGSQISIGVPPDRYNVRVRDQHWVIDTPNHHPPFFRCILVCERVFPKPEAFVPTTPDPKTKFKPMSGDSMNRACPLCSVSNPIVQAKCQKPECPL